MPQLRRAHAQAPHRTPSALLLNKVPATRQRCSQARQRQGHDPRRAHTQPELLVRRPTTRRRAPSDTIPPRLPHAIPQQPTTRQHNQAVHHRRLRAPTPGEGHVLHALEAVGPALGHHHPRTVGRPQMRQLPPPPRPPQRGHQRGQGAPGHAHRTGQRAVPTMRPHHRPHPHLPAPKVSIHRPSHPNQQGRRTLNGQHATLLPGM